MSEEVNKELEIQKTLAEFVCDNSTELDSGHAAYHIGVPMKSSISAEETIISQIFKEDELRFSESHHWQMMVIDKLVKMPSIKRVQTTMSISDNVITFELILYSLDSTAQIFKGIGKNLRAATFGALSQTIEYLVAPVTTPMDE